MFALPLMIKYSTHKEPTHVTCIIIKYSTHKEPTHVTCILQLNIGHI